MKGKVDDKLLQPIGNTNAFLLSCEAFLQSPPIRALTILYKDEGQLRHLQQSLEHHSHQLPKSAG